MARKMKQVNIKDFYDCYVRDNFPIDYLTKKYYYPCYENFLDFNRKTPNCWSTEQKYLLFITKHKREIYLNMLNEALEKLRHHLATYVDEYKRDLEHEFIINNDHEALHKLVMLNKNEEAQSSP